MTDASQAPNDVAETGGAARVDGRRLRSERTRRLIVEAYMALVRETGQMPTAPQVRSGLAPQLSLEAAILRAGRFGTIPKGASIAEFIYVSLRGVDPPGQGLVQGQ